MFSISPSAKFKSMSTIHFHSLSCSSCQNTILNLPFGSLTLILLASLFQPLTLSFFSRSPQTASRENLLPTEQEEGENPLVLPISVQIRVMGFSLGIFSVSQSSGPSGFDECVLYLTQSSCLPFGLFWCDKAESVTTGRNLLTL